MEMMELKQRKPSGHKKKNIKFLSYEPPDFLMPDDSDDMMTPDTLDIPESQDNSKSKSLKDTVIYYAVILLNFGLWIVFAWLLSNLHLGAPCFLLPPILWLYFGPMHKVLKWAKGRLRGRAA